MARGIYRCLVATVGIALAAPAVAAELPYRLDGLGGAPIAATCEGCFEALLARPAIPTLAIAPPGPSEGASVTTGGSGGAQRVGASPTALANPVGKNGWVNVRVEADPAEPVSFVMGMNVADRADVSMDNLARNDVVRFPATRVVAGLRFDLGREQ